MELSGPDWGIMSGGNQWNQITHKANWLYASLLFPVWLCIRLSSYLSVRWRARDTYKEGCCPFGGVGPTLKVCEEKGLWWNGPGRTVTSPLRPKGHAGLAWFACEWACSIILVRELSHQIEKVKTSFYQPFPSETEQAINNWVQALGKVKQNDMGLVKRRGGICQIANGKGGDNWCNSGSRWCWIWQKTPAKREKQEGLKNFNKTPFLRGKYEISKII